MISKPTVSEVFKSIKNMDVKKISTSRGRRTSSYLNLHHNIRRKKADKIIIFISTKYRSNKEICHKLKLTSVTVSAYFKDFNKGMFLNKNHCFVMYKKGKTFFYKIYNKSEINRCQYGKK